uniref:Uncharacterized protein n=1 Tax=Echeneis naucrates TaxID=173247 RepID=A0A665T574_ECHNA
MSRASLTSNSSWYSLIISCSFASMVLRCLSRSADRISSSSLIRSSEVDTCKCTHPTSTKINNFLFFTYIVHLFPFPVSHQSPPPLFSAPADAGTHASPAHKGKLQVQLEKVCDAIEFCPI